MPPNGIQITVLKTDGSVEMKDIWPTANFLLALQETVGGYIEYVFLGEFDRAGKCIIVNEEGRLKGLPTNPFFARYHIVGDVVLVNKADFLDEEGEE